MRFLSRSELLALEFVQCGRNVQISERCALYGTERISIGNNVRVDDFAILFAEAECQIGSYVHIGAFAAFGGRHGITMRDFSTIGQRVSIFTASDDFSGETLISPTVPPKYTGLTIGRVTIDRHAVVATGTVILPGVHIGEGAGVGALSLVKEDLEPWGIYAGVPARWRKARSRNMLELERRLLAEEGPA